MPVHLEEVERIAHLARLSMSHDDIKKMSKQLSIILEYVEKLNEVDTSNIEPLSHPLNLVNVFRKDRCGVSLPVEKALENAPDKSGNYFKVPKVIGK